MKRRLNKSDFFVPSFLFLLIAFLIPSKLYANPFPTKDQLGKVLNDRGFYMIPTHEASLFDLYKVEQDTLVTADLLLHAWHRVFDASTRVAEITMVLPEVNRLSLRMFELSLKQAKQLSKTSYADLAFANAAYFAVAAKLLDETWPVPEEMAELVNKEVTLIKASEAINPSPVMSLGAADPVSLDYGLFLPRGHYSRTSEFARLFYVYSWFGKANFYIDGKGEGPIVRAFLLTHALFSDPETTDLWERLNAFIGFLAGSLDDASPTAFQKIIVENKNEDFFTESTMAQLIKEAGNLPMPLVDSEVEIGKHRVFTFLGQRLSLDERIIDEVIDPKTPERYLPSGLDVAFALGSAKAANLPMAPLLQSQPGDPTPGRLSARNIVDHWPKERWQESLGAYWLAAIRGLYHRPEGKVQKFIEHPDWEVKLIQTGLSAWTEMRHDLVAFVKPHYRTLGISITEPKPRWWSYVEPYPETYRQISLACEQYRQILSRFEINEKQALKRLESLGRDTARFEKLAKMELAEKALEIDEYDWIRNWPIKNRWLEKPPKGFEHLYTKTDQRMALVVDVAHSLIPGQARASLQEAVGDPSIIIARAVFGDETVDLKGGTYSHYEFVNTSGNLLTDEQWQAMVPLQPRPPYLDTLYGKSFDSPLGNWLPLTVNEPFGGFYQYGDVLLGPDDSLIVPVMARKPGAPNLRAFLSQLWLELGNDEYGLFAGLVDKIPEAATMTAYAFFSSDRGQEWTLQWLKGFSRMVPRLVSSGILPAEFKKMPAPESFFDEMNHYGFYALVPKHSGVFIWRKSAKKPEKLIDVPPGSFAISPDKTKLAVATGPPIAELGAQGDIPATTRIIVVDIKSGKSLFDKKIKRAPIRPRHYGGNNMIWEDHSTLFINRGKDWTDNLKIHLDTENIEYLHENPYQKEGSHLDSDWSQVISKTLNRGLRRKKVHGDYNDREWLITDGDGKMLSSIGVINDLTFVKPTERNWQNKEEYLSPDQTRIILKKKITDQKSIYFLVRLKDLSTVASFGSERSNSRFIFIGWSEDRHALFAEYVNNKDKEKQGSWLIHVDGNTGQARRISPWDNRFLRMLRPLDRIGNRWIAMSGAGFGSGHFLIQQEPFFQPDRLTDFPLIEKTLAEKVPAAPFKGAKPVPSVSVQKEKAPEEKPFALPGAENYPQIEGEWPIGKAEYLSTLIPHRVSSFSSMITSDSRYLYIVYHQYKDGLFPLARAFGDMIFQYRKGIGNGWAGRYLWDYLREATNHANILSSKKGSRYLHRASPEESGLIRCELPNMACNSIKGLFGSVTEDSSKEGLLAVLQKPYVMLGGTYSSKEGLIADELIHLDKYLKAIGKPISFEYPDRYGERLYPFKDGVLLGRNVVYDDPDKKQLKAKNYEEVFGKDLCTAFYDPKEYDKSFMIDATYTLKVKSLPDALFNDIFICLENGQSFHIINHFEDNKYKYLEVQRPDQEVLSLQWKTSFGKPGVPRSRVVSPEGRRLIVAEEIGSFKDRKNLRFNLMLVDLQTGKQEAVFSVLENNPKFLFWLSNRDIALYRVFIPGGGSKRMQTVAIDLTNRKHYLVPYLDSFPANLFRQHTSDGKWALFSTEERKTVMLRLPKTLEELILENLESNETTAYLPDEWKKG